jgi:cytochrome c peroxidase
MKRLRRLLGFASVLAFSVAAVIDLDHLDNYASQPRPAYITRDNSAANPLTDAGATLGRVLFYDKQLSLNRSVSCASCHQQRFAFGDTARQSRGLSAGKTGRHSMRLINSRFAAETRFFWDERAASLEQQASQPIRDHVEMGFSGSQGDPGFDSLLRRLPALAYYPPLFRLAFGDTLITEARIQQALAQFVRSIQSFDSRYDQGRALVNNDAAPFPNFTAQENQGKMLFLLPPGQGGAGCQGCHRAPEFDIDPNSLNNGVIGVAGGTGLDLSNTRAPSLRDLTNPLGIPNGPFMHDGSLRSLLDVINHYDSVPRRADNPLLDPRLAGPPNSNGQNLNLSQAQKNSLAAFLRTLSGSTVYTDPKWSNPFDSLGNITLVGGAPAALETLRDRLDFESGYAGGAFFVRLGEAPPHAWEAQLLDPQGRLLARASAAAGSRELLLAPAQPASGLHILTFGGRDWLHSKKIFVAR